MMNNEILNRIGEYLASQLDGFIFVKSDGLIIRKTDRDWQAISIDLLSTGDPKKIKMAACAHVRIDDLEVIYNPYHIYLDSRDRKNHPTLSINCDELISDKSLAHGFFCDEKSVADFAESYAEILNKDVVPWLEKYSKEDNIYNGLISDDPMKWITSDRLVRYPVLLALLVRRNNNKLYDIYSREFIEHYEKKRGLVHKPLVDSIVSGLNAVVDDKLK